MNTTLSIQQINVTQDELLKAQSEPQKLIFPYMKKPSFDLDKVDNQIEWMPEKERIQRFTKNKIGCELESSHQEQLRDKMISDSRFKNREKKQSELSNPKKKMTNQLTTLQQVRTFIKNLLANQRIQSQLNNEFLFVINDLSSGLNIQWHSKNKQVNQSKLSTTLCSIPIFTPYSPFIITWIALQALMIIAILELFSLIIFFQLDSDQGAIQIILQSTIVVFIMDSFIKLNSGFLYKGNIILNRSEITKNYIKNNFCWDMITLLSLGVTLFNQDEQQLHELFNQFYTVVKLVIQLLMFTKFFRLLSIIDILEAYFALQEKKKFIFDLIKLILTLVSIIHVFGCFWHSIAYIELNYYNINNNWMTNKQLNETNDIYTHYIYSIYFLTVTMISIGYGDITPQNPIEMTFAILIMLTTGMTFAYTINAIGSILQRIRDQKKKKQEDLETINLFLKRENITNQLRMMICNYVEFINDQQYIQQSTKEQQLINRLSSTLQMQLKNEVLNKYLLRISFLQDNFSQPSLKKLIRVMQEHRFNQGDIIFNENDSEDLSLYFIISGEIEIYHQLNNGNNSTIINVHQSGEIFGQLEFVTGLSRSASARAGTYCRVIQILRQDFIQVMKITNLDYETFIQMKEQVLHQNKLESINIQCYQCKQTSHIQKYCPKTHMYLDNFFFLKKYNYSIFQNRQKPAQIRKLKCFRNLQDIQIIQFGIVKIIENEDNQTIIQSLVQSQPDQQEESDYQISQNTNLCDESSNCISSQQQKQFQYITQNTMDQFGDMSQYQYQRQGSFCKPTQSQPQVNQKSQFCYSVSKTRLSEPAIQNQINASEGLQIQISSQENIIKDDLQSLSSDQNIQNELQEVQLSSSNQQQQQWQPPQQMNSSGQIQRIDSEQNIHLNVQQIQPSQKQKIEKQQQTQQLKDSCYSYSSSDKTIIKMPSIEIGQQQKSKEQHIPTQAEFTGRTQVKRSSYIMLKEMQQRRSFVGPVSEKLSQRQLQEDQLFCQKILQRQQSQVDQTRSSITNDLDGQQNNNNINNNNQNENNNQCKSYQLDETQKLLLQFDGMMQFQKFMPHNNFLKILKDIRQKQLQKMKENRNKLKYKKSQQNLLQRSLNTKDQKNTNLSLLKQSRRQENQQQQLGAWQIKNIQQPQQKLFVYCQQPLNLSDIQKIESSPINIDNKNILKIQISNVSEQ